MKYYLGPMQRGSFGPGSDFWKAPDETVGSIDLRSLSDHALPGVSFFAIPEEKTLGSEYRLFGNGHIRDIVPAESDRAIFASMLKLPTVSGTTLLDWLWDVLTLRADPDGTLRVRPLMPTTYQALEIHLGGHSLIATKKFRLDLPEAVNCIAVMREDYRKIRQDALDGRTRDPEHHRRVLDYWGEKFRVENPEDFFIPVDLPKEKRLKHSTTIADNFNRADSTSLGSSSEGWSWTEVQGDTDIASNRASQANLNGLWGNRAETDLASADHWAECRVYWPTANLAHHGGAARFNATANTYYRTSPYNSDNRQYLSRMVSGSETHIGTAVSITHAAGDIYRCEANGSTIRGYQNGVERRSETDTNITGNLRTGFGGWHNSTWQYPPLADDFQASDLAAATTRGMPFGHRSTAFAGGRTFEGNIR